MGAIDRLMTFLGFSEDHEENGAEPLEAAQPRRSPVFNLHAQRQWEIVVLETQSLEDARRGAEFVKARRPVVVNLRGVEVDQARRIVDFLSGATYALDGHLQRVGEEMFLFAPSNVTITAEFNPPERTTLFPIE